MFILQSQSQQFYHFRKDKFQSSQSNSSINQLMDPTLLYNNYHLQRRKMYQNNPRSNLHSTIDFTWRQSVEQELSPKEKMERKKEIERRIIGERSNQLIAKRLKREVLVDEEVWKSAKIDGDQKQNNRRNMNTIDVGSKNDNHSRSLSVYDTINRNQYPTNNLHHMKDTLNQQVQNYYSTNKFPQQRTNNLYPNRSIQANKQQQGNRYDNYTRHFDPQLQSLASRQSMASSQLTELIPKKKGYLGSFLGKKLEKYLIGGVSSREGSFYDLEAVDNSATGER